MFSNFFSFQKSCLLWDNMEKLCTVRQATDDKIIQRIRFACLITKATETHSEYVILIPFSTAAMVTGTRINITLYAHCLTCLMLNMVVLIVTTRVLKVNLQLHGCLIKRCNIQCTDFKNFIIQCSMEAQAFCFSQLLVIVMCSAHCIPSAYVYTVCSAKSIVSIVTISYSCTKQTVQ
jgi:hypothetical protein